MRCQVSGVSCFRLFLDCSGREYLLCCLLKYSMTKTQYSALIAQARAAQPWLGRSGFKSRLMCIVIVVFFSKSRVKGKLI